MGTSKLMGLALAVFAGLASFAPAAIAKPQPGDLDRSFGGTGVASTQACRPSGPEAGVAIDRSKRIVVACNNSTGFTVARFEPYGEPDPSFGLDGQVPLHFHDSNVSVSSVAVKPGGVIVAGTACPRGGHCQFAITKLRAQGGRNRGFGERGTAMVDFGKVGVANSVAIDPRGRIVVAGTICGQVHCDFGVARLTKDGELDRGFSKDGRVVTNVDPGDRRAFTDVNAMAIDSRGRIVAAGNASPGRVALVRYAKDGHPNGSFGRDGIAVKDLNHLSGIDGIAVTPKDKIVAAGGYKQHSGGSVVLARFDRSGRVDSSFGKAGEVVANVSGRQNASVGGVALDSKNRIVVAGKHEFTVARFKPNGNLDHSFGHRGRVTKDINGAQARAVTIDSRNRPVVAGDGGLDLVVARFIG